MNLKLNSDKIEYILFGSQVQLKKISPKPLNAHSDLFEINKVVRYLGGFLDKQLNFKQHIKEKVKKAMTNLIKTCNTKVSHSTNMYYTCSNALHHHS